MQIWDSFKNFTNFESDFSLQKGCLDVLKLMEEDTVHIPWMNEISDHQRSLLELKETHHQLTKALCPGKDKRMILKISRPTSKLSELYKSGSHLKMNKKIYILHILILPSK